MLRVPKGDIIEQVKDHLSCNSCPFQKLFPENTFVAPVWGTQNRLVVAESPGSEENLQGLPLVGGSGKWFDTCLRKAGINRDHLTIINTIQCQPPGNVYPTDNDARSYISKADAEATVKHCYEAHVKPILDDRKWQRIDLLGAKALEAVTGLQGGIFQWRGSPLKVEGQGDKPVAVATLHPSYLARDQVLLPVAINDLRKSLQRPPEYYNTHPSIEDVRKFNSASFAFDIELTGWWSGNPRITMVGLCDRPYHAIVVPFQGSYISELKRIFKNAKEVISWNGLQFDIPYLKDNGVEVTPECQHWDGMLLQHLRFPDLPHSLEFAGSQFTSKGAWKYLKGDDEETYCARDVDVTMQCFKQLRPMVEQGGLMDLYRYVQVPLAKICKHMSEKGFKVNPNRIGEVRERITADIEREEQFLPEQLRTHDITISRRHPAPPGTLGKSGKPVKFIQVPVVEKEVPWASPVKVGKWLHEELGLIPIPDLKTGKPSTGKIALDKHYNRTKNRAIKAVKNLKKMNSLITLFCKEEMLKQERVHTHFSVHGTSSGRLSSADPNLQNISPAAKFIYVPSHPGWSLVEADFSQIENRLTAWFANDTDRLGRFFSDPDFSEHKWAASVIFDLDYDLIEKDNDKDAAYGRGKRINHGSGYGLGAKKLAMMYDLIFSEVKLQQDKLKSAMPLTVAWQRRIGEEVKREGVLTNPFSRKRWLYTSSAYTEGLSYLPQSTGADIIFRAMIALMYERIGWPLELVHKIVGYSEPLPHPANLLLSVHDSLVIECPDIILPKVIGCLSRVMPQPWKELGGFSIPIEIKVGPSWGEMKKYDGPIL